MGSFGAVCFASNQTISDDDEVIVFPIIRQNSYRPVEFYFPDRRKKADENPTILSKCSHRTSSCYSDCHWSPAGPAIYGTYADYGEIALTNSPANIKVIRELFDQMFMSASVVMAGKENSSHEIPFDIASKYHPHTEYTFEQLEEIWEYMWEAVMREDRVFLRDYQGNAEPMSFSMMHKSAADYLIKMVEETQEYKSHKPLTQLEQLAKYLNKSQVVSYIMEDAFEDSPSGQGMKYFGISKLFNLEDFGVYGGNGAHAMTKYYYMDFEGANAFFQGKTYPFTQDAIAEFKEIVQPLLDVIYIFSGLEKLNIKLSPAAFGHQDYSNEIGTEYKKFVSNVCGSVNKIRKNRYDDEDDEEYDEDDLVEDSEISEEHLGNLIDVLYDAVK